MCLAMTERNGYTLTKSISGKEYVDWLRARAIEDAVGTEVDIVKRLREIALSDTKNAMAQQNAMVAMKILLDRYYPMEKEKPALAEDKMLAARVNRSDVSLDQKVKKFLNTYTVEKGEYREIDSAKG